MEGYHLHALLSCGASFPGASAWAPCDTRWCWTTWTSALILQGFSHLLVTLWKAETTVSSSRSYFSRANLSAYIWLELCLHHCRVHNTVRVLKNDTVPNAVSRPDWLLWAEPESLHETCCFPGPDPQPKLLPKGRYSKPLTLVVSAYLPKLLS